MGSKLSAVNPYLRDPIARKRGVFTSVSSSSAIEGIRSPFKQMVTESSSAASDVLPRRKGLIPVKY